MFYRFLDLGVVIRRNGKKGTQYVNSDLPRYDNLSCTYSKHTPPFYFDDSANPLYH